eukprot:9014133-Alexandrium_andersonii.AAC.1
MSASLVGSEMCIRDSPAGGYAGRPAACGTLAFATTALRARGRHSETVSYTHLTLPTICSV